MAPDGALTAPMVAKGGGPLGWADLGQVNLNVSPYFPRGFVVAVVVSLLNRQMHTYDALRCLRDMLLPPETYLHRAPCSHRK